MWPPTLDELKQDRSIPLHDQRDDERLSQVLDAAVAFVQRIHAGRYNFDDESGATVPDVPDDVRLGTLRLAGRWHIRRRSPDALVQMAEMGSSRVPSFDPDIDRLLRIGRFGLPVVA